MTRVAIVVLNWNGFDDTKKCIDSLLSQSHTDRQIIVVDNNSADDSVERLMRIEHKHSKEITVIANSTNKGFAGGVNTGIQYALEHDFEAVALFNNDAVADTDWLTCLVKELHRKDAAIVTGLLLHQDGKTIDSTGDYYSIWGMPFPRSRGESAKKAPESGFVFSGSGGASLYRTSLFKEVGLFDERFFMYYEDVDMSFRAQLAGHKVYYTNKAIAYHNQGASSKKVSGLTVYQTFKNIPLLFIKNAPARLLFPVGARLFVLYWLIFGNAVKNGSGTYALKGWLASIGHFWTASLWQRFAIQRNKKVPAGYIKELIYPDLPPDQTGMRKLRRKVLGKQQ